MQLKKIIIIYLISIVLINSTAYALLLGGIKPFSDLGEKMIIIKIKPLKYALVFAHGNYASICYPSIKNCTYTTNNHFTFLNDTKAIPTKYLLDQLKEEGFERVWLSQCMTGNYQHMYYNSSSGERIDWYSWVSRNKRPGVTYPIFYGLGFIRV